MKTSKYLQGLGAISRMNDAVSHEAEKFLANLLDHGCKAKNFNDLCNKHMFHHTKSSSLQMSPPTSQGLALHIERSRYDAYIIMHGHP